MSMPKIPDICPEICIDREDSINLLLASIALEEFSLADLIEVESKKIKTILDKDKCNKPSTKDILDANNTVNQVIKNIIKLQILLQFKLENIIEIMEPEKCIPKEECNPKEECIPKEECKHDYDSFWGEGNGCGKLYKK